MNSTSLPAKTMAQLAKKWYMIYVLVYFLSTFLEKAVDFPWSFDSLSLTLENYNTKFIK